VRIIVSGFAFSLATTLWDRREALHQSRMADMATGAPLHDTLSTLQGMGLSELAGKAVVTRGMEGQAYLLASIDVFHVSMWICLALTGIVWLCHRTRKPAEPAVAAD
jgi:DHA2 family multidrug resistance protein